MLVHILSFIYTYFIDFEINSVYESLVEEWGEEYAAEVLDVSIYITDRDRKEASSFRAEIRNTLLYQSRKVLFIRPKLPQMINNHLMQLFKVRRRRGGGVWEFEQLILPYRHTHIYVSVTQTRPSHSCTLLAFCGGPQLSRIIGEAISEAQFLSAATGYGSHTIDYVSESYGGVKKSAKQGPGHVSSKAKKGVDASELWQVVKSESVRIVNTKRGESRQYLKMMGKKIGERISKSITAAGKWLKTIAVLEQCSAIEDSNRELAGMWGNMIPYL